MSSERARTVAVHKCDACGKGLKEGVRGFCGEECRLKFVESLKEGTPSHPGRTVARRLRRRGG